MASVSLALVGSCNSGGGGGGGGNQQNIGVTPRVVARAVIGRVVDVDSRDPIKRVRIRIPGEKRSGATDSDGFFFFQNLTADEVVLQFSHRDYASSVKKIEITDDGVAIMKVYLKKAGDLREFDSREGGFFDAGDVFVFIEPGSIADPADRDKTFSGVARIRITPCRPGAGGTLLAAPGSFEDAIDRDGIRRTLETFGLVEVELTTSGGVPLQLREGFSADLTIVLPDFAQDEDRFPEGSFVGAWDLDETDATWKERLSPGGIISKNEETGVLSWRVKVDHFSWWNVDAPIEDKQCVTGRLTVGGEGISSQEIIAEGVDYGGISTAFTDTDGFYCVDVKRGAQVRISAPSSVRTRVVPDDSGSCEIGNCLEENFTSSFDACIQGRVTDDLGNPVVNLPVAIVPGETVVTDADGRYCGKAFSKDGSVELFAPGGVEEAVAIVGAGSCAGGGCAEVDLVSRIPREDELAGLIEVFKQITPVGGIVPQKGIALPRLGQFLDMEGYFFVGLDAELLATIDRIEFERGFDCDFTEETLEDWLISRRTCTFDVTDPGDDIDESLLEGIAPLDAGDPIVATSVTDQTVNLRPLDAADTGFDESEGIYLPDIGFRETLFDFGFEAGTEVEYRGSGGAGLGALAGDIVVPPDVTGVVPDVRALPLESMNLNPLTVKWDPHPDANIISIEICSFLETVDEESGGLRGTFEEVCIFREVEDAVGEVTIPLVVMQQLLDNEEALRGELFYELFLWRTAIRQLGVEVPQTGLRAIVQLGATNETGTTEIFLPDGVREKSAQADGGGQIEKRIERARRQRRHRRGL